jgi:hypothetical protein
MASEMFKALKASAPQAPTNIVNGDVLVVEEIQGAGEVSAARSVMADTVPRAAAGPRPKYKPVDASHVFVPPVEEEPAREVPSNNYDLVGDDIGAMPEPETTRRKKPGRVPLYSTNAQRQKAYRERKAREAQESLA